MKSKLIFLMLINILLGESIFSPKEFKARRLKLAKKMELGSIAILQGAPSETGYVKFRQYNEFYYLTGIETPHSYVIIKGQTGETTLYLPNKNNRRERSEGPLLSAEDVAEVKALNNVDQVASVKMMGEHLWRMRMRSKPIVYLYQSPQSDMPKVVIYYFVMKEMLEMTLGIIQILGIKILLTIFQNKWLVL